MFFNNNKTWSLIIYTEKLNKKRYSLIIILISFFALAALFSAVFFALKYISLRTETTNIIEEDKSKISEYEYLLNNYSLISLNTIFTGAADYKERENARAFTAFSLYYKDKFYIITAGHSVDYEDIKYDNFRFKKQNRDNWIYPELFFYSNDYKKNDDFAVFVCDDIKKGLYPATDNQEPAFILGASTIKIFKKGIKAGYGESGSPVINSRCQVVGVLIKSTGEYTDIQKVTDAIDKNLK